MSEITSARGRIREAIIDTMDPGEMRELVSKVEAAAESGFDVDETAFEEYVGEVLGGRS